MKKFYLLIATIVATVTSALGQLVLTSSGTYVVPANVTSITVELVGRGGAGGSNGGGGGGGGGYSKGTFTVTPGQSIPYTVATASNITTAIPSLGISATNGSAGGSGSSAPGGAGGWGIGGSVNYYGGNGGNGHYTYYGGGGGGAAGPNGNGTNGAYPGGPVPPNYQNPGGAGGTSGGYPGGNGGKGAGSADPNFNTSDPATPGGNYGGGAGGGNGVSSPASAPGNGVIIITENIAIQSLIVSTLNNVAPQITTNGGTLQMVATILPNNANQNVTWSIIPVSGAATINASGLITAVSNGTVWAKAVSVFDNSKKDSMLITISNQLVPITSLTVTTLNNVPAEITTDGGTLQMVATILPANADQSVSWSIVPVTGAATISASGLVTAQADGIVWAKAISVQDNSKSDSVEITISNQIVPVTSVTVVTQNNIPPIINTAGGTLQMEAIVLPLNANQDVTWSIIPQTGNAFISSAGLVMAITNGTVWAKAATVQNPAIVDSMLVTISNQPGVSVEELESKHYQIYPNPTKGDLIVKLNSTFKYAGLKLIDITGRTVINKTANSIDKNILNLSELPVGMYLLQINIDGKIHTEKINKN